MGFFFTSQSAYLIWMDFASAACSLHTVHTERCGRMMCSVYVQANVLARAIQFFLFYYYHRHRV